MTLIDSKAALDALRPLIDSDEWQIGLTTMPDGSAPPVPIIGGLPPDEPLEESYVAGQHPRGREGQWVDAPDRPKKKRAAPAKPTLDLPRDRFDKYIPPFDADVQKITGTASAEAFFKGLGIEAHLDLSKGVAAREPEAQKIKFYRELAQATKDGIARSPGLTQGKWAQFRGIRMSSTMPQGERAAQALVDDPWITTGVWAVTGPDPAVGRPNWKEKVDGEWRYKPTTGGEWIAINDTVNDPHLVLGHVPGPDGGLAAAGSSIYGRFTHELGHALADTTGFSASQGIDGVSGPEVDAFNAANLGPADVNEYSLYGTGSPFEGWAETYSTLYTPHGMDGISPPVVRKMHDLQAHAVYDGFHAL